MNKKIKMTGLAVCLACCTGLVYAQETSVAQERQQQEKRLPREVPNPEKMATQMTNQMKESLQLTDKQYKKIYKINLKEQKEFFQSMQNSGGQRPPMGGLGMQGGPGMQGGRPPMGGPGEPPMMGEGGFPGRAGGAMMNKNDADSQKKAAEAKEKKIKKILTAEQYEKWQTEQAAARKKAFQRKPQKEGRPSVGPVLGEKEL